MGNHTIQQAEGLSQPLIEETNDVSDSADEELEEEVVVINKDIRLPTCLGSKRVNHNVLLNLLLAVMYGLSGSLWNGTAYVAYLKKLGHDKNGPLGNIEAVSGLATLVAALPVGYLADRFGRSKVIAAGGIVLLFTSVLQIRVMEWVGISLDDDKRTETALFLFGMIMWLWGIGDGVVNGPCAALYADSTPKGERSVYYNYLFACYSGASAVGPLVSIIMFQTLGDNWGLRDLRVVIYVGLGIEMFNALLMMFFDDRKSLDESEESSGEETNHERVDLVGGVDVHEEMPEQEALPFDESAATSTRRTSLKEHQKWIPYIIFTQDSILAVGSGMTIKFFPLFFKDDIGMSPSQVQVIYCLVPFAMVICSTLSSKIAASGVGRVQTQLITSTLGVSLLYAMVFFKGYLDSHPVLLVPIFVVRTSLMNASYPLQESILMDFVPKESRARWKSLDAVASFGWCGSAAFGGWLTDKYDYTYTFFLTAVIQSIGILTWMLLLPLVPRQENAYFPSVLRERRNDEQQESEDSSGSTAPPTSNENIND